MDRKRLWRLVRIGANRSWWKHRWRSLGNQHIRLHTLKNTNKFELMNKKKLHQHQKAAGLQLTVVDDAYETSAEAVAGV